jgi:hypothetical protein
LRFALAQHDRRRQRVGEADLTWGGRIDTHDQRGDVVLAAMLVRESDQMTASDLEIGRTRDHLEDFFVLDHAAQAVGTEHVQIANLGVVALDIDGDLLLHAERARDDVLRQLALLLFRELGHREQVVVHQRVIARHLTDLVVADAVGAAVANVPDEHLPLSRAE